MPIETVGIAKGVGLILRAKRVVDAVRHGPSLDAIYEEHYREWLSDLAAQLAEVVPDVDELRRRLAQLETDRERLLVLGNFGHEAWREALDERRRMLGDAAVRLIVTDTPTRAVARIERAIRQLDHEDLLTLRRMVAAAYYQEYLAKPDESGEPLDYRGTRRKIEPRTAAYEVLMGSTLGTGSLIASGCVLYRIVVTNGMATLSNLGDAVLRFMGHDPEPTPDTPPDLTVLGRGDPT